MIAELVVFVAIVAVLAVAGFVGGRVIGARLFAWDERRATADTSGDAQDGSQPTHEGDGDG